MYWIGCAAPIALLVLALAAMGALSLAGADCTYPNTPHALDGGSRCNALGDVRDTLGWLALLWGFVTVAPATILLVGGVAVAAVRRRRQAH